MHWVSQFRFSTTACRIVTRALCNLMYLFIECWDGLNADVPWPVQHEEVFSERETHCIRTHLHSKAG
jgi:hypothetical protein